MEVVLDNNADNAKNMITIRFQHVVDHMWMLYKSITVPNFADGRPQIATIQKGPLTTKRTANEMSFYTNFL